MNALGVIGATALAVGVLALIAMAIEAALRRRAARIKRIDERLSWPS